MDKSIAIYDCTLREGSQASDINFSLRDKLRITQLIDELGFAYAEGGWPGSNAKDHLYFKELSKLHLKTTKIVGFGRTRLRGMKAEDDPHLRDLIETGTGYGHIFGKGWDFHVTEVLRIGLNDNLDSIYESVAFLKKHLKEVSFGFEHFFDAYKGNPEYSLKVVEAAISAGVDWIDLADTNGGCFPHEVQAIISTMTSRFSIPFAVHCHNDTGCGVANTVTAVMNGVRIVEGTINGYSERCGMADLCTVIPNLQIKLGYKCIPDENLSRLTGLSQEVADLLQTDRPKFHPYVGSVAFTHKGGVHVDAFLKNPRTYEHIDPALVGNHSNVVVSEVSGRANLNSFLATHRLTSLFTDEEIVRLLGVVKELEFAGYEFNTVEESLLLLILRESKKFVRHIDIKSNTIRFDGRPRAADPLDGNDDPSHVASYGRAASFGRARRRTRSIETDRITFDAVMDLFTGERTLTDERLSFVVESEQASFSWVIERMLASFVSFFPVLAGAAITDYKVRAVSTSDGYPYRIRVVLHFTDNQGSWRMLGLGRNVVSATINAVVDAVEYRLNLVELDRMRSELGNV